MDDFLQITSVIAIIKYRSKYLLVQRDINDDIFPGKWQNLGGKIELGESVEDALRREIEEEVGIDLNKNFVPQFILSWSWKKDDDAPVKLGLVFQIKLPHKPFKIKLGHELSDCKWVSLKEARKLDTIGQVHTGGTIGQLEACEKLEKRIM